MGMIVAASSVTRSSRAPPVSSSTAGVSPDYTTAMTFFGHAVGETNEDLKASSARQQDFQTLAFSCHSQW